MEPIAGGILLHRSVHPFVGRRCAPTCVIAYSISTYCRKQTGGSMGDLAYATAAYGYFAARYFAK